jgi:diguanylate cyclase
VLLAAIGSRAETEPMWTTTPDPDVSRVLQETRLPPGTLELEITENIGLTGDVSVIPCLRSLCEMSDEVAFDDFGTGYASLTYLTRYPLSQIKIDQSFVRNVIACSHDNAIVDYPTTSV